MDRKLMFRISEKLYKEFKMICHMKGEYIQEVGSKVIADYVRKEKNKVFEDFGRGLNEEED